MVYRKDRIVWCITRIGQYGVSQGLDSMVYHKDWTVWCITRIGQFGVSQGLAA